MKLIGIHTKKKNETNSIAMLFFPNLIILKIHLKEGPNKLCNLTGDELKTYLPKQSFVSN